MMSQTTKLKRPCALAYSKIPQTLQMLLHIQGIEARFSSAAVGSGELTLAGGSERTVFRFQMEVERLVATLLFEEEAAKPLALAQVDDVRFNLRIHPDTLNLTMALGNLKAQDGQLAEVCFHLTAPFFLIPASVKTNTAH